MKKYNQKSITSKMQKEQTILKKTNAHASLDKNASAAIYTAHKNKPTQKLMIKETENLTTMSVKTKQPLQIVADFTKNFSDDIIQHFSKVLFPVVLGNDLQQGLDTAIRSYYQIQRNRGADFQVMKTIVTEKAMTQGEQFKKAIQSLLSHEEYSTYLEQVTKPKDFNNDIIQIFDSTPQDVSSLPPPRKLISKTNRSPSDPKKLRSPINRNVDIRSPIGRYSNNDLEVVNNLDGRGICICDQTVLPNSDCFQCIYCKHTYHFNCMKRNPKIQHCLYCHLQKLIPTKPVKKTLFVGVLKKGIRRHQFTINLPQEELTMRNKIQVRCFRIKQSAQNFVLFPDSFQLLVNKNPVKSFEPLHKQSCLKFRKDEPFLIDYKYMIPKDNKVVVNEKLASKEMKYMRIEADTHLIGIYVVQDKRNSQLMQEIMEKQINTIEQSKAILNGSFINSNGQDQVSCDIVKIPLQCHLSKQKLKIPVRGLFCTHFLCFDLNNFVTMTSKSTSLRWNCPQCRRPCYQFIVDCVILSILEEYEEHPVSEVMFFKTGAYSVSTKEGYVDQKKNAHINDLDINKNLKRAARHLLEESSLKKKKPSQISQPGNIIELD